MQNDFTTIVSKLFGPGPRDGRGHLWARWLFLRAMGLIFFSAFYSLAFQILGLIGPDGILPAGNYLQRVAQNFGPLARIWYTPTLLWLGSGSLALKLVWGAGLAASILIVLNVWPRAALGVCLVCFLSFVSAAQDFSSYQSDGMLLSAAFLCLFFAPRGLRPGLGEDHPPSRASLFLLQWLWFCIYFESGVVKIASGETQWRHLTAMDHYYENGPLPNWIGWYVQQLPHRFHAAVALYTLAAELALVWMLFLPRRWRVLCFFLVTPFQIGIILTANLTFLNHFVLALGVLLLDDQFLRHILGRRQGALGESRMATLTPLPPAPLPRGEGKEKEVPDSGLPINEPGLQVPDSGLETPEPGLQAPGSHLRDPDNRLRTPGSGLPTRLLRVAGRLSLGLSAVCLTWVFYNTVALLLLMVFPWLPLPTSPIAALEPFRIANQYGLFAVMTRARYEIEFQGSRDGKMWTAYPFRYKPQDPSRSPRIHAPYQPRFDWNLWFASLETWRQYPWVVRTEELLLQKDSAVLSLFAGNPFPGEPPRQVRAMVWRYWFTDLATKRKEGLWWHRELRGLYAPTLERQPDGKIAVVEWPGGNMPLPPPESPEQ